MVLDWEKGTIHYFGQVLPLAVKNHPMSPADAIKMQISSINDIEVYYFSHCATILLTEAS